MMLHRRNRAYKPFRALKEGLVTQGRNKAGLGMALGVTAALALSGCASTPEPAIGAAASQPRSDLGQDGYSVKRPDTYLLRPTDKISVTVFREPDLSVDTVRIGVEGNVSLQASGRALGVSACALNAASSTQATARQAFIP